MFKRMFRLSKSSTKTSSSSLQSSTSSKSSKSQSKSQPKSKSKSMRNRILDERLCSEGHFYNNYKLTKTKLGHGTSSVVNKCMRRLDSKEFAVKIIDKRTLNKKDIKALQTELYILRKVRQKSYFINLADCYETSNMVYIVMELCTGGTLYNFITHNYDKKTDDYISKEAICKLIFKQIIKGVHLLHKHGIVHRDLKPENILLTVKNAFQIKISDFGLSSYGKSIMNMKCGSPHYVAPEILLDKCYTAKVDWWSCGVLLYSILSGCYPFASNSPSKTMLYRRIASCVYSMEDKSFNNISSDAKDLISKLLVSDPDKRYGYKQIMHHPWLQN